VFLLRFSPFLRTIVSLPAGLSHMPQWKFLAYTFAGAAVWNVLLVEGGRRLAPLIDRYESYASWAVIGFFGLLLAVYAYRVATWKPRHEREG
jgi:membrane protein DedA with SNARE-associated domain